MEARGVIVTAIASGVGATLGTTLALFLHSLWRTEPPAIRTSTAVEPPVR